MEYHKIHSVYKRGDDGNFTEEFSRPEFEYLRWNEWEGTEKIDGTNIRVFWRKDKTVDIRGRTDKAKLPTHLSDYLHTTFQPEVLQSVFPDPEEDVVLYGEGFGYKIQKGSDYVFGNQEVSFALFDVKIGMWWLQRTAVGDIAHGLGVPVTPIVFEGTLYNAITYVRTGFPSRFGTAQAEGLVLRPKVELKDRSGQRIITKLKTKDWK